MAVSPLQLRKPDVAGLIEKIDEKIQIEGFNRGNMVFVAIGGEMREDIKTEVTAEYLKAGWSKVEIINSSENGERPGMCGIKLYK